MAEIDLGIDGLCDFKEVGSGGFATVYSADEPDAGRLVAVKVLASMDERGRRRFDRERRTMGQTTAHENIVTMFRSGFTIPDNRPYLVMEYMSGGSLQDRLDANGPVPLGEAIRLLLPVARALGDFEREFGHFEEALRLAGHGEANPLTAEQAQHARNRGGRVVAIVELYLDHDRDRPPRLAETPMAN